MAAATITESTKNLFIFYKKYSTIYIDYIVKKWQRKLLHDNVQTVKQLQIRIVHQKSGVESIREREYIHVFLTYVFVSMLR